VRSGDTCKKQTLSLTLEIDLTTPSGESGNWSKILNVDSHD